MSQPISNNSPAPTSGSGSGGSAANAAAIINYMTIIAETLQQEDTSANNSMIANGQSEITLGVNVEQSIGDYWFQNPTTVTDSTTGQSGTGNGEINAYANLEANIIANDSNYASYGSGLLSAQNSTEQFNMNSADAITQTYPTAMTASSNEDKTVLGLMPDVTGIYQMIASMISTATPA